MESSEQDTKSTSGARSTNTPNLPFFFSPYVISRSTAQPGCWPALMCVNSLMTPGRWAHSRRSTPHRALLSTRR
ncbi:hypothetical protein C1J00_04665 [Streptomyces cahuitamycinicus]|uniref:Uncharacterized protein n=1 Tax=Streptomyces cahuitamycinicus TaxID=2070367 RepID=A0A2N8TWC8_9ACTN|nr:hypothetical protein C1J00_04665 [Streptomyces cahuitamycinicus]